MAKLLVQHDDDPGIAIILEEVEPGDAHRARGWHGSCTECGYILHRWHQDKAIENAQGHVDRHESHL
jgi:hypothetical protein